MQLSLPIHQIDDETLENFCAENGAALLDSLRQNFDVVRQPFFYVWGAKSSGKSHLLKALTHYYLLNDRLASYIPLEKLAYFSPAVLDNADKLDVICLDDIQYVVGDPEWEQAIFNLINQLREQHGLFSQTKKTLLLISADCSPQQLKLSRDREDLRSRLSWGEVHHLGDLKDEQKREILRRTAYDKGLELTDEVANFLLKRLDRDLSVLKEKLERLDQASLQAQRKLTLPFVKDVLGL
ncbi:DnaA regulatory inactivator Hda [Bibersteinia trehalosi]|uniref:Uncharacterized protein n=3 Tax=Bibersteinia trehalosi TaxID=47735 RepID=W0R6D3_BIBTR|nr:DnaA regulatory inactivator Hda [Bibersteinia trehalosi]AHG86022.1 hypothetical protein F544_7910 [Bibersteinia trehalosi USDA-ARS-USMARC-190]OAQ15448.1 DNA replication protein [Bibersteinia trehalosi Y31]RRN02348.1 DnaA regulatory inactivator Hda [Bibersteinia trehalosi]TCT13908.1 regulatory inactivation of DnaA Hda protein [Bibersteinia trehalosi]